MSLLRKTNKDTSSQKSSGFAPIKVYTFTSSKGFRGYKRTHLTTQSAYSTEYQKNVDRLVSKYGNDLFDLPVVLEVWGSYALTTDRLYVRLILDGLNVGAFYDGTSYFDEIVSGRITAIHFRSAIENIADAEGVHPRNKLLVFVKLD